MPKSCRISAASRWPAPRSSFERTLGLAMRNFFRLVSLVGIAVALSGAAPTACAIAPVDLVSTIVPGYDGTASGLSFASANEEPTLTELCTYQGSGAALAMIVYNFTAADKAATAFAKAKENSHPAPTSAEGDGIGDDAYWQTSNETIAIQFRKGTRVVSLSALAVSPDDTRPKMVKLAQSISGNL